MDALRLRSKSLPDLRRLTGRELRRRSRSPGQRSTASPSSSGRRVTPARIEQSSFRPLPCLARLDARIAGGLVDGRHRGRRSATTKVHVIGSLDLVLSPLPASFASSTKADWPVAVHAVVSKRPPGTRNLSKSLLASRGDLVVPSTMESILTGQILRVTSAGLGSAVVGLGPTAEPVGRVQHRCRWPSLPGPQARCDHLLRNAKTSLVLGEGRLIHFRYCSGAGGGSVPCSTMWSYMASSA